MYCIKALSRWWTYKASCKSYCRYSPVIRVVFKTSGALCLWKRAKVRPGFFCWCAPCTLNPLFKDFVDGVFPVPFFTVREAARGLRWQDPTYREWVRFVNFQHVQGIYIVIWSRQMDPLVIGNSNDSSPLVGWFLVFFFFFNVFWYSSPACKST